jgi:hypothetical protein
MSIQDFILKQPCKKTLGFTPTHYERRKECRLQKQKSKRPCPDGTGPGMNTIWTVLWNFFMRMSCLKISLGGRLREKKTSVRHGLLGLVDEDEQKVLYRWELHWPSLEKGHEGRPEIRRGVDVIHFRDGKITKKLTYSKTTLEINGERVPLSAVK